MISQLLGERARKPEKVGLKLPLPEGGISRPKIRFILKVFGIKYHTYLKTIVALTPAIL